VSTPFHVAGAFVIFDEFFKRKKIIQTALAVANHILVLKERSPFPFSAPHHWGL